MVSEVGCVLLPASGANRPALPDIRGLQLEIHNMDLDDKRLCTVRTDLIGECPGTLDGLLDHVSTL